MSLALRLYRAATALAEPLAPALLRGRAQRGKEDGLRLRERLGHASLPRPTGALVWLHGASVGESLSLLPLIEVLRTARPDTTLLVTSGTVTSAELLAQRLPEGVVHQYAPVDAPGAARRFVAHWRPSLAVFSESDLWPNLISTAKASGANLALISARLSHESLAGWGRAPGAARAVFGAFDLVMAQDDATAKGLVRLGGRDDGHLNLKLAACPLHVDLARLAALQEAAAGRPVLLAASTHPGEDEIVREAFAHLGDKALLVIVPRHPARGPNIADLFPAATLASRGEAFGAAPVHIADALGELGLWFSLAASALIGGSLLPGPGGHNPLEPALLGCPALTGPHIDNWRTVYARLGDAVRRSSDAASLAAAWAADLADRATALARAARARAIACEDASGLAEALPKLLALIP